MSETSAGEGRLPNPAPAAPPPEPGLAELEQAGFADWASDQWGLDLVTGQSRCLIHGSPERAASRGVAVDHSGRRFLVEKFPLNAFDLKSRIARTLAELKQNGLDRVLVPETAARGKALAQYQGALYQVTRFVEGTDLPRPQWLSSREMGAGMGAFLAEMRHCAGKLNPGFPAFSITRYIYRLFKDMAVHSPDRHAQYLPVLRCLEQGFMDVHDRLPQAFCHGDFHPVNIIWDRENIRAVIDWEFTGIKPDCYDAANLLGCAGIEHPEGLVMPMATAFVSVLHREKLISPLGWQWLPEFVLALRFAWLSEWLRKEDREMLDTERRFMEILMTHREDLREIWAGEIPG